MEIFKILKSYKEKLKHSNGICQSPGETLKFFKFKQL